MKDVANYLLMALMLMVLSGCASTPPRQGSPESTIAAINLKLGMGYMQSGHFDVALEKLKKALEYDDTLAEAHNAIAVLYEETGETELAERHYRRAVDLAPRYGLARVNYGRFLCAHGKPAEGESQLLTAVTHSQLESLEMGYTAAGVCARMLSELERAEQHFRKALELNPNAAGALLELAGLSHSQGRHLQARAFLERYHAQVDYSPTSLWLGVVIEEALGDLRQRHEYAQLLLSRFAASKEAQQLRKTE